MTTETTLPSWEDVTADPDWETATPKMRAKVAGIYARKVLLPQYGKATDPRLVEFLQNNVAAQRPVQGTVAPTFGQDITGAAAHQAQTGFAGTAWNYAAGNPQVNEDYQPSPNRIPVVGRAISAIPMVGPAVDTALDTASEINVPLINPRGSLSANPLNSDFWHGAAGYTGGLAGLAPDMGLAVGATLGGAAALGGGAMGLAAAGALTNEAMAGGQTAMRGGSMSDVLGSMAGPGLVGLVPGAASAIPAGRLNPEMFGRGPTAAPGARAPEPPPGPRPGPKAPPPPRPEWFGGEDGEWNANHRQYQAEYDQAGYGRQQKPTWPQGTQEEPGPGQAPPRGAGEQQEPPRPQGEDASAPPPPEPEQPPPGAQAPPEPDRPPFDFAKRKAEVQSYIDQNPSLVKQFQGILRKSQTKIDAAEATIQAEAPASADRFIRTIKTGRTNDASAIIDSTPPGPLKTALLDLRKNHQNMTAANIRVGQLGEEMNTWQGIMAKLLRGEEGEATGEGALGLPAIAAGGLVKGAKWAAGKFADLHDEIDDAVAQHLFRNTVAGVHVPAQGGVAEISEGSLSQGSSGAIDHALALVAAGHRQALEPIRDEIHRLHTIATNTTNEAGDSSAYVKAWKAHNNLVIRADQARQEGLRARAQLDPFTQERELRGLPPSTSIEETGPSSRPYGGRPGAIRPGLLQDLGIGAAKATGRAILSSAEIAGRVTRMLLSPVDKLDEIWRGTSIHSALAGWREIYKYGNNGGLLGKAFRRFFVTNYGVDPRILDWADATDAAAREHVRPYRQKAAGLARGLTSKQQEEVFLQVTEKPRPGQPRIRGVQAAQIADDTSALSDMLHDVGGITDAAHQRWRGYYLPREYHDKYPVFSGLIKESNRLIRGSKPRGNNVTMSVQRFNELAQDWEHIATSRDNATWHVRNAKGDVRLVPRKKRGDYLGDWEMRGYTGPGAERVRTAETAHAAAEAAHKAAPTPATQKALDKATTRLLDALSTPGLKVRAWRDWTLDERWDMGEKQHVSNGMMRFADKWERDWASGKLLQEIASNLSLAVPVDPNDPDVAPHDGWVKLDGKKNPDGTQRWGKLADHWVSEDTAHYLKWSREMGTFMRFIKAGKMWSGQNLWKRFVTVHNPSYYLNNFMQNVFPLIAHGGDFFDLFEAARLIANGDPFIRDLQRVGYIDNGHAARELAAEMKAIQIPGTASGTSPMVFIGQMLDAGRAVEAKGGQLSQATDDLFRVALAIQRQREGLTDAEAIKAANDNAFYDSSKVKSPASEIATVAAPFAKVFFYSLDMFSRVMIDHPARVIAMFLALGLFTEMAKEAAGYKTREQKAGLEAQLPDYQKTTLGLVPGAIPVPGGKVVDVHNFNPNQPVVGDATSEATIPFTNRRIPWPSSLMPGGPAAVVYNEFTNQDPFHQKPLREYTPEGTKIRDDSTEYAWSNLTPAWMGSKGSKLAHALAGTPDAQGRMYDVPTAAANMLGLKIQPLDNQQATDNVARGYKRHLGDLMVQIRSTERALTNHPTDPALLRTRAELDATLQKLLEEMTRVTATAQQGFPTSPPPTYSPSASQQQNDMYRRGAGTQF